MAAARPLERHEHIPLTRFHNNAGEFLDLSTRTPVILTSHGRERHVITDIEYFRHLEAAASGTLLAAMDLTPVRASNLDPDQRAAIEASRPTADEIANDKWND